MSTANSRKVGMTLHAFLKDETTTAHRTVDEAFSRIGFATMDRYRAFLKAQAGAVFPAEAALDSFAAHFQDAGIAWARRGAALRDDLAALGTNPSPTHTPLTLTEFDEAIGAAYVIEGSRLGGKMLSRQIRAQPDMQAAPLGFLDFPTVSGFWQDFTHRLDAAVVNSDCWSKILVGAHRAFDAFAQSAAHELEAME